MTRDSATAILSNREDFISLVIEKLGKYPCDFQDTFRDINNNEAGSRRQPAGVLVPLLFRESLPGSANSKGTFLFQLIKRSSTVPQPGDLGFPGGMIHALVDGVLSRLLDYGRFPIFRGNARKYAASNNPDSFKLISLFLTTALRESWEEIGLMPFRVLFLGPLPTYNLILFRRTIFPVAGFVSGTGLLRPNREVEKIIEIPLLSFYHQENFGCYQMVDKNIDEINQHRFPCLIHHDKDGQEEILWGATFNIIVQFLGIVLDYTIPDWRNGPVIKRSLNPDYITGSRTS